MDYNTDRSQLVLPEYGRNIQNMVDYAKTVDDRDDRLRCAKTIVKIMMQMNSLQSGVEETKRVCWDHLARMANYELDIDYPVEITREEEVKARPAVVPYPMKDIRMRQYGYLLEELMRKLEKMTDGAEKEQLVMLVANQMRKNLFYWNKDALSDERISEDLARYTHGTVKMTSEQLASVEPLKNMGTARVAKKAKQRK